MGQVDLAHDNDIRRTVAVKRLLSQSADQGALLRFADEVRIVGQLEHPGIVPIYDVGRAESGDVYLVMKHLQGETMESVIERLRADDPDYHRRFPIEHRLHLFMSVLDAMRYAHSRGILHRDLKPANIMIGPYGEVTILDWGIAKPLAGKALGNAVDAGPSGESTALGESKPGRLVETQLGALAGTPLYMSPEQAAGRNDELDERSDVYALAVVFFEWLALEHPLKDQTNITELLSSIIHHDYRALELFARAAPRGVPAEWVYLIHRALARDRDARIQNVDEFIAQARAALEGDFRIQCHITFAKRSSRWVAHWIDKHPKLYSVVFTVVGLGMLSGLGWGLFRLLGAS